MLKVPAPTAGATSASFETAVEVGSPVVTPFDLVGRREDAFGTVLAEDTVELARGMRKMENTDNDEETGPSP